MARWALPDLLIAAAFVVLAGLSAAPPLAVAGDGADGTVLLLSEENRPFNYTDPATGVFGGPMTAVAEALFRRAGIPYRIEVHPWSRSYRLVQNRPESCIFSINRTAEREPLFHWVGPFLESAWSLYAPADSERTLSTITDAAGLRIAAPPDSGPYQYLASVPGLVLVPVQGPNAFSMLRAGHVDLVASGTLNAAVNAKRFGLAVRPVLELSRAVLSMACNTGMAPERVAALQAALAGLRDDGTLKELVPWLREPEVAGPDGPVSPGPDGPAGRE